MDDKPNFFFQDDSPAGGEVDPSGRLPSADDRSAHVAAHAPCPANALQGGISAGAHPAAETLVMLNFTLHDRQAFLASGLKMACTDIVNAYVAMAEKSMLAARDRMAKEVQVEANVLPIAVGVGEVHLQVSILLPDQQVDSEKAELLRILGRLAKVSLDGALENFTTPQSGSIAARTDAPSHGGVLAPPESRSEAVTRSSASGAGAVAIKTAPGVGANPFDQVAAGLVSALHKKRRPGEIVVTVSTGDDDDKGTTFTIAKPDEQDGGHVTFTAETVPLSFTICGRVSNGLCEVKEAGASCRVRAKFGTSGILPLQLRLLDGGHPVTALVRRTSGEHAHDSRDPMMYIERLVELDAQWANDMGGLEALRQVLESLRALLPKVSPEVALPRGNGRR